RSLRMRVPPRSRRSRHRVFPSTLPTVLAALAPLALLAPAAAVAQTRLSRTEQRIKAYVEQQRDAQVDFLARAVDINSGTMNVDGVRRVGALFRAALDSLGFETRWVEMPESMHRAGHLVAEHRGKRGTKRILLIGHFDTVFEGEGQQFVREDTVARGAGSSDMKGGDVIILYALEALRSAKALDDANITVVFSGD